MERKPGGGRPARQDRQMVKIVKVERRKTAVDVTNYTNNQLRVSIAVHTAKNRLRQGNLLAKRPTKEATYD